MTANEVAVEVQRAIANRLHVRRYHVDSDRWSVDHVAGIVLDDTGPFVDESLRYAFGGGFFGGAQSNAFEGVYLDDFIIGFAERGELVTRNVLDPILGDADIPPIPPTAFHSVSAVRKPVAADAVNGRGCLSVGNS